MRRSGVALAAAVAGLLSSCTRTTDFGPLRDTSGGTTAETSITGTSTGTTGGASSGGSSGATTIGPTGTTSGTGGGTATGAGPFVDGGYVFCTSLDLPDAGPNGASWMCPPGTYFCNLSDPGNCFQCRSDFDCRNRDLPTYDPGALRCDVDSGVSGYQGFCHQCLDDVDCPDGTCDLVQTDLGPPLETLGFETCFAPGQECDPRGCISNLCNWDSGVCAGVNCQNDFDCNGLVTSSANGPFCIPDAGCVQCRDDTDCVRTGLADSLGEAYCVPGLNACGQGCADDHDCVGSSLGPACLPPVAYPFLVNHCGCATDAFCAGNPSGTYCDTDSTDGLFGSCTCRSSADCPAGQACQLSPLSASGVSSQCGSGCKADSDCLADFFCDPAYTCRPRCDPGHACQDPDPLCDPANLLGQNGETVAVAGPDAGPIWCYPCLPGGDCPRGDGCGADTGFRCGTCLQDPDCGTDSTCELYVCKYRCDSGICPSGQVCADGLCWDCLSPSDCPASDGCNGYLRTCGTCQGPHDCPPGDVCAADTCLQNCDARSCPSNRPICAVLPDLSPDHKYCFGCLQDSDCADAGPGAWCNLVGRFGDVSFAPFSCQVPPSP